MIHRVASPDDRRLDPYRHVDDPAWLLQQNLFVAEGRLVVERLIALDRFDVLSILINRAAHDALAERLTGIHADVLVCDEPTITSITGHHFHRGCLALASRPPERERQGLLTARRLLALEGVGNPDNVGGLFRTAAAFGVDGVLLSGASGDPLYRKAIRTSMGAALRVPFARLDDWQAGLNEFRGRGFQLVALTPRADATSLDECARSIHRQDRLIVLVGSEGPGLQSATLDRSDARVRIAVDSSVDSLNVVVAAGIALHALAGDGGVPAQDRC